jgi:hypothetical protein
VYEVQAGINAGAVSACHNKNNARSVILSFACVEGILQVRETIEMITELARGRS